nr:MAG TPA: hypothetical protein [Caudoviricetes sp.]
MVIDRSHYRSLFGNILWVGHVLYYLSKVFKIIGHTFMLEFASAKDELRTFWKHYTNLGDI